MINKSVALGEKEATIIFIYFSPTLKKKIQVPYLRTCYIYNEASLTNKPRSAW